MRECIDSGNMEGLLHSIKGPLGVSDQELEVRWSGWWWGFFQPHAEAQEQGWCTRRVGFEQDVVLQGKTMKKERSRFALLTLMKALSISVCLMKYSV